jgi:hypothetical protein
LFGAGQGGQQERREDGDDGNDHQQFDERERPPDAMGRNFNFRSIHRGKGALQIQPWQIMIRIKSGRAAMKFTRSAARRKGIAGAGRRGNNAPPCMIRKSPPRS